MMRSRHVVVLAAAFAAACSTPDVREWRASDHDQPDLSPGTEQVAAGSAPADASPDPGAILYGQFCAQCHGARGLGDGPQAAMTRPASLADAALQARLRDDDIRAVISRGKGKMPAFGTIVRPEGIDLLVRHVRSLASGR